MIEFIDLSKAFGSLVAVNQINLKISKGELFGFLGPNGAGKTTTIKMIVGLLKPTKGKILLDGEDISKDPISVKRRIGFIPDHPHLYGKLTAREFMRFIAGLYSIERKEGEKRAKELLDIFELSPWADELIEGFSHGMKQRLAMSGALIHKPDILVIDEPVAGLDPKGALLMKKIFKELALRGVTIFMSTHILAIAEEMCNPIAIINKGEIIAQGSIEELKHKAKVDKNNLEPIFLKLTGGEKVKELSNFLKD